MLTFWQTAPVQSSGLQVPTTKVMFTLDVIFTGMINYQSANLSSIRVSMRRRYSCCLESCRERPALDRLLDEIEHQGPVPDIEP